VRISDLSQQAGVPVATIKFYLRERLLPPGIPTGRNQADYGEEHLRRLALIRALANIGQLNLSSVHTLVGSIENHDLPFLSLYRVISRTVSAEDAIPSEMRDVPDLQADVDQLLADLGWEVSVDAPERQRLALALAVLQRLGCPFGVEFFAGYAESAAQAVEQELRLLPDQPGPDDRASATLRNVLLEVAAVAIRRLAHEHLVNVRFGSDGEVRSVEVADHGAHHEGSGDRGQRPRRPEPSS